MIILLLFSFLQSDSQTQLPNSNFENWTISENNRDSLIGWSSTNSVYPNPVISLYKDTAAYQGNYCANAVTAPFGFVQETLNGILVNGEAQFYFPYDNGNFIGGGTPISIKPTELNGYYKNITLATGDHAVAKILVSKYNELLQQRDTISYSVYNFTISNEFSYFSIPLYDLAPGTMPDTITTVFYVSNPATLPTEPGSGIWSNLYLDSLHLVALNTTAIDNGEKQNKLKIFPNPTNGIITINNGQVSQITVYNSLGKVVKTIPITHHRNQTQVNLSDLPKGIYVLEFDSNHGKLRQTVVKQ